ncbi:hypothetical protein ABIC02_007315 [Bradyrhizobium sp. RT5a]
MRGSDVCMEQLFAMKRLEDFVPADHPLRPIRLIVNEALVRLDGGGQEAHQSVCNLDDSGAAASMPGCASARIEALHQIECPASFARDAPSRSRAE